MMLAVVFSGACSDRAQEPAPAPAPAPEPQTPTAQVLYVPGRAHAPGDLVLQCLLEDPDGDLVTATLSGGSTDTVHTVGGAADTVSAEIRELAAGEYELVCTATDAGGRTHADTVTVSVAPNDSPAAPLFVTQSGLDWTIVQGAVIDPQGDTLEYTIEIEGPTTLVIGPRASPIDTTLTLPYGSYRVHSVVHDGFVADTTRRSFDNREPPTVAQSIVRDGVTFRYTATHTGTFARLTVTRSGNDTIYVGAAPADTTFVGITPLDQNGLLKGIYLFTLQADREGAVTRDVVLDSIIDLQPSVDLSGVDVTLDQEDPIVVPLPTPVDPNPEDRPTYTAVRSLDGRVEVSLSGDLAGAGLAIVGTADSTGAYAVELVLGNEATGVLVDTIAGVIRPRTVATVQVEPQDSAEFKSGYDDVVVVGGATSVGADLVNDDESKNPLLAVDFARRRMGWYYDFKRKVMNELGVALGLDYSFVNQFSSFSTTDTQAASGIFRVYGTWKAFGSEEGMSGTAVFRVENRHLIGSGVTPRDLGFDGGSSLSTATFKEFGWGITAAYWKQLFEGGRYLLVSGKMDPGDYSDVYPWLTAYTSFMGNASVNNPTVALPGQGFGIVGKAAFAGNWYASAGLHDANGSPTELGLDSFFKVREYYTWVEAGWTTRGNNPMDGEGVHVNLWHQDPREEAGTEETWGVTFSASKVFDGKWRWSPFLRAGYAEGDGGGLVRLMVAGGLSAFVRRSDFVGFTTTWSAPIDTTLRNQVTSEAFYRLQVMENLQATPNIQFTINPSRTLETDVLWVVAALRLRLAL